MLPAIASGALALIGGIGGTSNAPNRAQQLNALAAAGNWAEIERIAAGQANWSPSGVKEARAFLLANPAASRAAGVVASPAPPNGLADTVNAVVTRALAAGSAELNDRVAAQAQADAQAAANRERGAMLRTPLPTWAWVAGGAAVVLLLVLLFRSRS